MIRKMRVLARLATWTILALPVIGGCGKKEAPPPAVPQVKLVEAVKRDVPIMKEWVGQTIGMLDIEVRARVSGWLKGMYFTEGTEVKQGALLYTIDPSELQQAVAEAKGRVAQARTLMVRAKSDVDRYRPLAEAGAVSQRDLERALAEYGSRQGEVDAAQASLNVAEINLGYATITAPITGLIGISAARVSDYVGKLPNPIILNTISRIDSIHVRFSITEQEYLDLARRLEARRGQPSIAKKTEIRMVLADGSVFPHSGRIIFAQRQIDAATGTLLLEASFPNPGMLIRPGQFARLRAVFDEQKGAVVIPVRAVTEIQGQYVVYVVGTDNKAQFRRVQVGPKVGNLQVIEQGVATGDKIVVEGIQSVRPDMTVAGTVIPFPTDSSSVPAQTGGGGK
jgi:membrane fusion protein (multidrug efflux system)